MEMMESASINIILFVADQSSALLSLPAASLYSLQLFPPLVGIMNPDNEQLLHTPDDKQQSP